MFYKFQGLYVDFDYATRNNEEFWTQTTSNISESHQAFHFELVIVLAKGRKTSKSSHKNHIEKIDCWKMHKKYENFTQTKTWENFYERS